MLFLRLRIYSILSSKRVILITFFRPPGSNTSWDDSTRVLLKEGTAKKEFEDEGENAKSYWFI